MIMSMVVGMGTAIQGKRIRRGHLHEEGALPDVFEAASTAKKSISDTDTP